VTLGADESAAMDPEGDDTGAPVLGRFGPGVGSQHAVPEHPPYDLVSRRQAAQRFGIDPEVFIAWESDGTLTPRRKTPRGQIYYSLAEVLFAVAEMERAVTEIQPALTGLQPALPERDELARGTGLVLSARQLWAMVEEAREAAAQAREHASALEAEVRMLREMLDRGYYEQTPISNKAAEQARQWAAQWDKHEQAQQQQQQQQP
jgi:hypothetical protein